MQPTKCKIFLKGFCPKKELCQNSHDIKNCMSGPNCTIKNQCPDRHPPLCKNFVKNTCGFFVGNKFIVFSNCAFSHPVNVTFMRDDYPPPFPMPIIHSPCPGVTLDSRVSSLESRVQQLSTRLADVSAELAAAKMETKGTCKEGAPETPLGGQDDIPEKKQRNT